MSFHAITCVHHTDAERLAAGTPCPVCSHNQLADLTRQRDEAVAEAKDLSQRLTTICTDIDYVGGVQYWQHKATDTGLKALEMAEKLGSEIASLRLQLEAETKTRMEAELAHETDTGRLKGEVDDYIRILGVTQEAMDKAETERDEARAELQAMRADANAADEAANEEDGRWQDAIRDLLLKHVPHDNIDGGGCDSGDPLDYTLAEVGQAVGYFINTIDDITRDRDRLTARVAELEGDQGRLLAVVRAEMGDGADWSDVENAVTEWAEYDADLPDGEYEGADTPRDVVRWLVNDRNDALKTVNEAHSVLDNDPSKIVRNTKDSYPEGQNPRDLTLAERVQALCRYAADWKRWTEAVEAQCDAARKETSHEG